MRILRSFERICFKTLSIGGALWCALQKFELENCATWQTCNEIPTIWERFHYFAKSQSIILPNRTGQETFQLWSTYPWFKSFVGDLQLRSFFFHFFESGSKGFELVLKTVYEKYHLLIPNSFPSNNVITNCVNIQSIKYNQSVNNVLKAVQGFSYF